MDLNPKPGRASIDKHLLNTTSSDGDANLDTLFLSNSYGSAQFCVRKSQIPGTGLCPVFGKRSRLPWNSFLDTSGLLSWKTVFFVSLTNNILN
jgi:hypothetical protein